MTAFRSVAPSFLGRTESGGWQLLGRQCGQCAETAFGRDDDTCQRCGSIDLSDVDLGERGTLWSFTVLRNPPPGNRRTSRPEPLPQPLGLVELDGAPVRVMARVDVPVERLVIGLPLTLTASQLYTDDDGAAVIGYSFEECSDE
ncbi:protein of unknown function DUF35 [Mycolicibacterium rhodesiae JS60]|nr:protein of unknown function DUF35 [Mycolicibacterium rhodesiae JS60]